MGRWDLDASLFEPGAWFKGSLYPRRCDLSPDGRWLCYFALKNATWDVGDTYVAISRLPWLRALAAWATCGTWTHGFQFTVERSGESSIGKTDHGDAAPCLARFGMRVTSPAQFAVERRRGWREAPDCPPRVRGDIFDQNRNASMVKMQPCGRLLLRVVSLGWAGGEFGGDAIEGLKVSYWLEDGKDLHPLDEIQWADWDRHGRLLVATRSGQLQIRRLEGSRAIIQHEWDLSTLQPTPRLAPAWANGW